MLKTESFEFETVKVNAKGKIIQKFKKQANQYIEQLGNAIKLEMVEIPSGTFTMGSPSSEANRYSDEDPQHQVKVPSFYMGKYPVTQAQWQRVMENNPSYFKEDDNLPVENVSWDDAIEFCKKLSEKTGKTYRLPSEAEWEYACRAGTTTAFAFGETINPKIVNYDGNRPYGKAAKGEYRRKTIAVGSLGVANEFGLYDMHGNVWEWCQDYWHANYIDAPIDGSAWETISSNNTSRVLRGGSYNDLADLCRSADRLGLAPDRHYNLSGFRLVMSGK
jgi:formylglycine-generating enzyme required for sulfatase activity